MSKFVFFSLDAAAGLEARLRSVADGNEYSFNSNCQAASMLFCITTTNKNNIWTYKTVSARYFEGPLFRKFIVWIRATVLRLGLGLCLGSALGLGLGLVEIVNFCNSGPLE